MDAPPTARGRLAEAHSTAAVLALIEELYTAPHRSGTESEAITADLIAFAVTAIGLYGDADAAVDLAYRSERRYGLSLTEAVFTAAIEACARRGDGARALALVQDMVSPSRKLVPMPRDWHAAMSAASNSTPQYTVGMQLVELMGGQDQDQDQPQPQQQRQRQRQRQRGRQLLCSIRAAAAVGGLDEPTLARAVALAETLVEPEAASELQEVMRARGMVPAAVDAPPVPLPLPASEGSSAPAAAAAATVTAEPSPSVTEAVDPSATLPAVANVRCEDTNNNPSVSPFMEVRF